MQSDLRLVEQVNSFRQIFNEIDANGDGSLSATELHDMLCKLGVGARPEDAQAMIEEADADGSGTLEVEEFLAFMARRADRPDWEIWWQDWAPSQAPSLATTSPRS